MKQSLNTPVIHGFSRLLGESRQWASLFRRSIRLAVDIIAAPKSTIVFPDTGHKQREATDELSAATSTRLDAGFVDGRSASKMHRIIAVVYVVASYFRLRRIWKSQRLKAYVEVLTSVLVCESALKHRKISGQYWLIVGDLTTNLIALAIACRWTGQKIVYWQYSNLDFKRLPVPADLAVILNTRGVELSRIGDSASGRLFWRPRPLIEPVRMKDLEKGPIGAFLNVHAQQGALEILSLLQEITKVSLWVRLHPNTPVEAFEWPDSLQVAPSNQSLNDFTRSISIAVCGNTQAQTKSLALGTPVVQIGGLDALEFDHHGFVNAGIVLGIREPEQWSFEKIYQFYSTGNHREALEKLMGPGPEKRHPGLSELLSETNRCKNVRRIGRQA